MFVRVVCKAVGANRSEAAIWSERSYITDKFGAGIGSRCWTTCVRTSLRTWPFQLLIRWRDVQCSVCVCGRSFCKVNVKQWRPSGWRTFWTAEMIAVAFIKGNLYIQLLCYTPFFCNVPDHFMVYDMIYIGWLQLGWHPVAAVRYSTVQQQYGTVQYSSSTVQQQYGTHLNTNSTAVARYTFKHKQYRSSTVHI
jgi:hypothetical protein